MQIEDFYRHLYRKRDCQDTLEDVQEFLGDREIPQFTELENKSLKEEIRKEEDKSFLFSLSDNKAPGKSSLTPVYYKEMWPD